jgi:NAD(P)-dependent dehydrogenase (short-subunit alcohol dehydrogenase family)
MMVRMAAPNTRSLFDLEGRVAVVVGGTSGIGRVLALGLAEAGAHVIATARRAPLVEDVASEIEKRGRRTLRLTTDVLDRQALAMTASAVLKEFGRIDTVLYCAGRTKRVPTLDMSNEDWQSIMDTNLTGALRTYQVFARPMIDRKYGRLIGMASLSSFVGLHEVSAYTTSKAGIVGLTRALAVEWGPHGINVNAIAPGFFPTKMTQGLLALIGDDAALRAPLRRLGGPEDLKGVIALLASDAGAFITGQVIAVDGGVTAM